jgi:hypothetical protein
VITTLESNSKTKIRSTDAAMGNKDALQKTSAPALSAIRPLSLSLSLSLSLHAISKLLIPEFRCDRMNATVL